jgi:hypothetical protein
MASVITGQRGFGGGYNNAWHRSVRRSRFVVNECPSVRP